MANVQGNSCLTLLKVANVEQPWKSFEPMASVKVAADTLLRGEGGDTYGGAIVT
jgi:hypothetical protein